MARTASECSIGGASGRPCRATWNSACLDQWRRPRAGPPLPRAPETTRGLIGSRPSRCIFLRASLRARRIASACSRVFFQRVSRSCRGSRARFFGRHLRLNGVQEADELLMTMALHTSANDLAFEDIESSEQRRCAMALVVVGHRAGSAFLHRQAGLGAVERHTAVAATDASSSTARAAFPLYLHSPKLPSRIIDRR